MGTRHDPSAAWARASVLVALACGTLAGCAQAAPAPNPSTDFDTFFLAITEFPFSEAAAHGLSPDVVDILTAARERGHVTSADVDAAVNDTLACFDDLGVQYTRTEGTTPFGLPEATYTFRAPAGIDPFDRTAPWLALADQCQTANSMYVTALYEGQPTSTEQQQAWFVANLQPQVVACLIQRGIPIDGGATLDWFITTAKDYFDQTGDSACLELIFN